MAKSYPQKQTIAVFFICLLFVLGALVLTYGLPNTKNSIKYESGNSLNKIAVNNYTGQNDEEWRKQFFDSKNTSETFKNTQSIIKTNQTTKEEDLNPTEIMGRNFFAKYVELKQTGQDNNNQAVEIITNQIISEGLSGMKTAKVYTNKEIKVIADSSDPTLLKNYAEGLMKILNDWVPKKSHIEIAMQAMETGDMSYLVDIDPLIKNYQNTITRLLALPVMQSVAQSHLDLINGISMQNFNAQGLRKLDKDPLTGLMAVSMELKSLENIALAIDNIKNYFDKNQVNFIIPVSSSIIQNANI